MHPWRELLGEIISLRAFKSRTLGYWLVHRSLLRVLLFSIWFRLAFLLFVLAIVLPLAALAPLWRSTPEGVTPVYRLSIVNWIQAKRLLRTGNEAVQSGRFAQADLAFRSALLRHPAEPEISRALLRNAAAAARSNLPLELKPAIIPWLLQLSGTNLADLELAADLMCARRDWPAARKLLEPVAPQLSPLGSASFLKALYHLSPGLFREEWDRRGASQWADPELSLYRTADVRNEQELRAWSNSFAHAVLNPQTERAARALEVTVSERWRDPARYGAALAALQRLGGDTLELHARYWRLLAQNGGTLQARSLALRHNIAAGNPRELMRLAEAFVELRLFESALELLKDEKIQARVPDRGAVLYTDILRHAKEWERLRLAARHIRELFPRLQGYSIYLEALAEDKLGRPISADIILQKLPDATFDSFPLAAVTIESLIEMNRLEPARLLLEKFDGQRGLDPLFWRAVCQVSTARRDSESLARAARNLRELRPDHPDAEVYWNSALIASRSDPAETLRRTAAALSASPNNPALQVNHALALNLNHRYRRASALLQRISPGALSENLRARYFLALFEAELGLGRIASARQLFPSIDQAKLFTRERADLLQASQPLLPGGGVPNVPAVN